MEDKKLRELVKKMCGCAQDDGCSDCEYDIGYNDGCDKSCSQALMMDGADAIEALLDERPQLISVKDGLPEDGLPSKRSLITVLVTTRAGRVTIASRCKNYANEWRWNKYDITHWMSLPKPAKEE